MSLIKDEKLEEWIECDWAFLYNSNIKWKPEEEIGKIFEDPCYKNDITDFILFLQNI